jgi:hypothetical protein
MTRRNVLIVVTDVAFFAQARVKEPNEPAS